MPPRHAQQGRPETDVNLGNSRVYAIDVCIDRKLGSCKDDDEDKWIPLNEWDTRAPDMD